MKILPLALTLCLMQKRDVARTSCDAWWNSSMNALM